MSSKRVNQNAMDIAEYRKIKEALKTVPINKKSAKQLGRGTTTLATIKKSKSFKHYKELRRLNRGKKKATEAIKEVNAQPIKINVEKVGRVKKIAVIRKGKLYEDGDMVVVPAALFEALSEQMTELSEDLKIFKAAYASPVAVTSTFIETKDGQPVQPTVVTFKERLHDKIGQIKKRWEKK